MNARLKLRIMEVVILASMNLACPLLYAAAGNVASHSDYATAQHIDELPPEIRDAVWQWQPLCGNPLAARRLFAHYLEDKTSGYRLISLHFHELNCNNMALLCTKQGCLHQVYVSTDSIYRLAFGANVPDLTLRFIDHKPALEINCSPDPQCPLILRWDGRGFSEQ